MSTLLLTILAAVVIMAFVVLGFAVGKLITGKNRLRKGCGMRPKEGGKKHCDICGKDERCDDDDDAR